MVPPPNVSDIDDLSDRELKALVIALLGKVAALEEKVAAPAEEIARFKGYESFAVQDLKIEVQAVCYRRERWLPPDGRTVIAPLPLGINDHFGPEIKRFILDHQDQTTVPRLVELLRTLGVDISKRQEVRILTDAHTVLSLRRASSGQEWFLYAGRQ